MSAVTDAKKTAGKGRNGPVEAPKSNGLGLEGIGDLAGLLDAPAGGTTGAPIDLRLDDVEEDPHQPRETFTEDEMAELRESIKAYGVKVPVSVHPHPEKPGRYVLNDGARRYRASIEAGKETIPAVVVEAFSLIEQLVVNKVRADTPPKDKAKTFARLMKEHGWTQRQLVAELNKGAGAERSGFSEAYISQHMALLNLPAPVEAVFDGGRCTDVTLINELAKAYKKKPAAVEAWLADEDQEITRGSVRTLREFLEEKRKPGDDSEDESADGDDEGAGSTPTEPKEKAEKEPDPSKVKKAILLGVYKRRPCRLLTNKRWSAEGFAWVKYEDDGEEVEVELGQLKLNRLIEA